MLTKQDIKDIKSMMLDAMVEFYDTVIFPTFNGKFDSINDRFDSVDKKLEKNEQDHVEMKDTLKSIDHQLRDHDRRIDKLEAITSFKS